MQPVVVARIFRPLHNPQLIMSRPLQWDIFCRVVDNFGDIGVSWRLARILAAEHALSVRLWVDDLAALRAINPDADVLSARQSLDGVEVCRWPDDFCGVTPGDVAIEAFGCGLPDEYVAAMVEREPRPLWITLEYLSAEPWVASHHALPSPHPRFPLQRYFFFPGFVNGTGGLLREAGLFARRDAHDTQVQQRYWASCGFAAPPAEACVISLFAYETAPLAPLLAAWEQSAVPVVAAIPIGKLVPAAAAYFGVHDAAAGQVLRRGRLEVRILPFVPQPRYDELLWCCDYNFVRGEDSFVRAQWAARPLIWQPYQQEEGAHLPKLEAFLELYCRSLPQAAAQPLQALWRWWNQVDGAPVSVGPAWNALQAQRAALGVHAHAWAQQRAEAGELAENLVKFCASRVK
jgi:uncharacterized repeat protein (TIGR03837 family)